MAPLPPGLKKPSARSFRQQRLAGAVHPLAPLKTFRPDAAPLSDDFASTKRDKRLMKHSSFMSRVVTSGGVAKKSKTRQQPTSNNNSKRTGHGRSSRSKLATTLDDLADALPALQDGEGDLAALQGRVRHKSISSKKGALRRKERVVRGEMERFGVSMAQLAQQQQQGNTTTTTTTQTATTMTTGQGSEQGQQQGEPAATSSRWAALRGYISSTMEQNPAFVGRQ
ncbi:ribosome biogenesis protein SLX9 domain-containing protein [Cordyceps javanica]|uniref:Ribosome biogenesis protein SLX9 n=1 Tax=Cordyceps javanica TaxID=43265 RepID=A0A545ULQ7_9HYPO|nr:ribosome biogenesis protein SLX9 domain-containing protein [Cordyceps javanica]